MPPQLITLSNAAPLARVSMLLWGEAGCGKTFFANTAPGKRLIINLDPDGYQSLPKTEDTLLLDVANESHDYLMNQSKTTDPFNIKALISQNPYISTVIVDSVTKYSERAVQYAIGKAPGSTAENPGPGAYGYRNR